MGIRAEELENYGPLPNAVVSYFNVQEHYASQLSRLETRTSLLMLSDDDV